MATYPAHGLTPWDTPLKAYIDDQDALSIPSTEKGAASGVATLDGGGTIPDAQIPGGITRDAEAQATYARMKVVTPEDYGATGDGIADDTAELQAAMNAAAAAGAQLWLGQGKTYKVTQPTSASVYAILVPSNLTIVGRNSTILTAGVDQTKTFYTVVPSSNSLPGHAGIYNALQVGDTGHDITIRGVIFQGENNPGTFILGHQAAALDVAIPATTGSVHDIVIEDCTFTNLWGFSVHQQASALRVHVRRCRIVNCGNTINNNADESEIVGNTFTDTSVVEASGSQAIISDNIVTNCWATGNAAAFSIGGRVSGPYGFGGVVARNVINGAEGYGIAVADGTDGYVVANNTVRKTKNCGIIAVAGATNPVKNLLIQGNTVVGAGLAASAANFRIGISAQANTQDVTIAGNTVIGDTVASYSTFTGLYGGGSTRLSVSGNSVSGTSNIDASFDNCPGVHFAANKVAFNKLGISGTTTYAQVYSGPPGFAQGGNGEGVYFVTAVPESSLSAPPGSIAVCKFNATGIPTDQNGFSFWFKEYGFSNTGWVPMGGSEKLVTKTTSYTIVRSDRLTVFNGASLTASLPDPTTTGLVGRKYKIKNIHSTALAVVSLGTSKTIDGAASVNLAQWAVGEYLSDGTQWLSV